ncbi:hypothetical protein [Halomonas sp. SpR8]|uniref:hypothetical protein n=1 Tax=Halomonas sp. SpR8 TaxID=3050463 RepID=UPI0027E44552|nr:hypothetical protein [Halomonas sp. SpR8]MDQ7729546.1 hypothetical protein [Halomonas sp. SpR8]
MNLQSGESLTYWQVLPLVEEAYDVADTTMEGEMDSTFFLTKEKNWIPHTYPCRTAYIAERRDRPPEPQPLPDWQGARNVLPMGSPWLDLSGFWFRPTRIRGWARTAIKAEQAGTAHLRAGICGTARIYVNGRSAGWLSPATRNAMAETEIKAELQVGNNDIVFQFEDLCERDAVIRLSLIWLSGPAAQVGYPFETEAETVREVERALEAMHLDRAVYDGEEIELVCPHPFTRSVAARAEIAGHFMSHGKRQIAFEIPAGAERVRLCPSRELPADYRYFDITVNHGGFTTTLRLGAEITHRSALGIPAETLTGRIEEALGWIAANAESDTERALACLDEGSEAMHATAEGIIEAELPAIEQCHDCADFSLVPLLWSRINHGHRLSPTLLARIDAAILDYRYWMDEPGNDVQWYFSENHALLFHTACYLAGHLHSESRFRRSGRIGAEQRETGRQRLMAWFDHFESAEMAEFNSAPYFPIDLKGFTAIHALSPDDILRERAARAIERLVTIVANSAHQGFLTGAQGRSYQHSLCVADTLELTGLARLLWRKGSFGSHVHCLAQLALCLRDHGLTLPETLGQRACWQADEGQEWIYQQGENGFSRLYHYKTRDTAMGSAARYRWFEWGYQETLIHARIGTDPHAQTWINHPGERVQAGFGRPSFWGGSASIPRVQQYRNLAIVVFEGHDSQPNFTHCWFPTPVFDEWQLNERGAVARSGRGVLALTTSGAPRLMQRGASAHHEIRVPGQRSWWVVRLGRGSSAEDFLARHQIDPVREQQAWVVEDPDYGRVLFHDDGRVEAEGRLINPSAFTLTGYRELLD